jgi:hypothetical protein
LGLDCLATVSMGHSEAHVNFHLDYFKSIGIQL